MVRSLFRLTKMSYLAMVVVAISGLTSQAVPAQDGDVEAGKQKSATCVACHGPNGISVSADFPHLAGQVPGYIAIQLANFKSGERSDPIMQGMSAGLSDEDMADLDAYYVSLDSNKGSVTPEQESQAVDGSKIYRGGYEPYSIAACMSCHGPSGHGIPPAFPRVSGQGPAYLEAQLLAFKSGARKNSIMNPISFALSEEQIKQLSLYMSAID